MFATANQTVSRAVIGAFGTALCAGICLLAAAGPAQAAPVARTQVVSYADLNLAHPDGRSALNFRIKRAAQSVCSTGSNNLEAQISEARCVRSAVEAAKARTAAVNAASVG